MSWYCTHLNYSNVIFENILSSLMFMAQILLCPCSHPIRTYGYCFILNWKNRSLPCYPYLYLNCLYKCILKQTTTKIMIQYRGCKTALTMSLQILTYMLVSGNMLYFNITQLTLFYAVHVSEIRVQLTKRMYDIWCCTFLYL